LSPFYPYWQIAQTLQTVTNTVVKERLATLLSTSNIMVPSPIGRIRNSLSDKRRLQKSAPYPGPSLINRAVADCHSCRLYIRHPQHLRGPSEFVLGERLNEGSFGKVHLGTLNGKAVAVKVLHVS